MKNKKTYIIIALIILVIIILDQIIKAIMTNQNNETAIKDENLAGAILTDILIISILLRFLIRQVENMSWMSRISLSFIMAGGMSNFIERLTRGKIINYIDISQIIHEFPAFNISNIFIIVGFIIFIITVAIDLIKIRPKKLGGN